MFDKGCKCEECKIKKKAANDTLDVLEQRIEKTRSKGVYPMGLPMAKIKEIIAGFAEGDRMSKDHAAFSVSCERCLSAWARACSTRRS